MILVFDDKMIYEKFAKELKGAYIYHRDSAEIFGSDVSSEDYMNRLLIGASIPFYREIYRKQVAQGAIDNEFVLLDSSPGIPDEVKKCPVIYITERTEGNDEEFGQLPVKYAGSVEATLIAAREMMKYWIDKYGENRSEKDFYKDFLNASVARVPDKLRIIAAERVQGAYVAGVTVDFTDDNIMQIKKCIHDTEKAGYAVFVDEEANASHFRIEDYFYTVLEAKTMDSFIELCNTLEERNNNIVKDYQTIKTFVKNSTEEWRMDIYHTIYLEHEREAEGKDYKKIPAGYIQIKYNSSGCDLRLEELGIEEGIDDVVFLSKVLYYITEKLTILDGNVEVGMRFYGNEKMEQLLP